MNTPVLGYVIRMFPQLSETFIANEILELERLGVRIRVYSYRRPRTAVHHEVVRSIRAPITYLPDPLYRHPLQLIRANQALYGLDPVRYRRTARYVLGHSLRDRNPDTWRRFLQAAYLAHLLKNSDVQHIHAHFAHGATRLAMLTNRLTGLPFSFTAHARDIYTADPRSLTGKIEAAEFVVTCTGANQEYLQQLVEPEQRDKINLRYHGIDLTKFSPGEPIPLTEVPLILSVGRLVEKKGLSYLVQACGVLKGRGYTFRCRIIGEGPERNRLEKMVSTLNLQDVVSLPGACSQEELLEIYRRATVFALPCNVLENGDRDGIPNVLLEAMAVQLPVVSSAVSGIPELIKSGDNGLLVEERNGEALASALELLFKDGALRERLGKKGRLTVAKNFDSTTNVKWLKGLFREGPLVQSLESDMSGEHTL